MVSNPNDPNTDTVNKNRADTVVLYFYIVQQTRIDVGKGQRVIYLAAVEHPHLVQSLVGGHPGLIVSAGRFGKLQQRRLCLGGPSSWPEGRPPTRRRGGPLLKLIFVLT